jgi:small subunit ribosomal protein S21
MLSCLLILFANRQETDRVVFSKEAAPGKHPGIWLGVLFLFYELLKITTHSYAPPPLTPPARGGEQKFKEVGAEGIERRIPMRVVVQDNQIEKAIRDLKKKLTKEGFFSEIKERRFYDKPSVQRKKKQAKAAKRRRKRMRKVY